MKRHIIILIVLPLISFIPLKAFAKSCTYTVTDRGDANMSRYVCSQSQIDDMWDRFDFDKDDWDSGFGYYDACNNRKPLKRTFNALYALKYAGTSSYSCNTSNSNMLTWAYCWSGKAIDELDGRCSGEGPGVIATTQYGPFVDNWTQLYMEFFYNVTMAERMSTIVHEARHANSWCKHEACGCSHGGCDRRYENGCTGIGSSSRYGAYGTEFNYLTWFKRNTRLSYEWLMAGVTGRMQEIMPDAFCENPCIKVSDSGGWYRSC